MMRAAIVLPIPGRTSNSTAVAVLMFMSEPLCAAGACSEGGGVFGSVTQAVAKKQKQLDRKTAENLAAEGLCFTYASECS